MLRTLWFFVVMVATTVWFAVGIVTASLLNLKRRPGGVYDSAKRWAQNAMWAAGVRYTVVGLDNLPRDRPVVVASNHQSWFDIFLLGAALPGSLRFVSKKELSRVPILGLAMRRSGHIFLDRSNRQAAFGAYEEAAAGIRSGFSAAVFPEGTRSRTGELLPFKKGPFVLAIAAGVPLVPAYCAGTIALKPKGRWLIQSHPVALLLGPPIDTTGLTYEDRESLMEQARRAIERLRDAAPRVLENRPLHH